MSPQTPHARLVLEPAATRTGTASPMGARQRARTLDLAARKTALAQKHLLGLALLAPLFGVLALFAVVGAPPLRSGLLAPWLPLAGWAIACGVTSAMLLRRRTRRRLRGLALAVAWSVLLTAAPPWLWPGPWPQALTVWVMVAAGAGAWAMVASPAAFVPWALVPALSSLSLVWRTDDVDAGWLLTGLGASLLLLMTTWVQHRTWRRDRWARILQQARLKHRTTERDAAWRTDQDKSRFLAIASHDLRQPVHALGLFAATLRRRLKDTPDEPLARNLMRAITGLERSFTALLDISRLDSGAMAAHLETFTLRDMFRRLQMQYGGRAEFAGLGLRFSPGGKSVISDPQLLERIVGNLVQNALKYTEQGGVVVVARSTSACVNIEVWDTGQGIAVADLPRIFDEFYQVGRNERDRAHGLGMGLAIVKRLAALLGHRLEVVSRPGHGTLFRVSVPLGSLPGIEDDLAPSDTMPITLRRPYMVLVVDDEEPIREGLRLLLQEWGLQAITASDADQADQAVVALEGHIDLIITDLHLGPGDDGTAVVRRVRHGCGHRVPALLITGDTLTGANVREPDMIVLMKPVQPRHLLDALHTLLDEGRAR